MMMFVLFALVVWACGVFTVVGYTLGHFVFKPKNSIDKCFVFEKVGDSYNRYRGKLLSQASIDKINQKQSNIDKQIKQTSSGKYYTYNHDKIILVPSKYPIIYWSNRRVIGVTGGNIMASPLGNSKAEQDIEKFELVKVLTLSHLASDMIKAMRSTSTNIAMIIIIIVVIVLALAGGLYYISKSKQPVSHPVSNSGNTTITLPPSGQVK